jgi:hypothetical protein
MPNPSPPNIGIWGVYVDTGSSSGGPRCQVVSPVAFSNRDWATLILAWLSWLTSPPPLLSNYDTFVTENNISNMLRWMTAENPAANNPANTTWWGSSPNTPKYPNNASRINPLNNGEGSGGGAGFGTYPDLNTAAFYVAELLAYGGPAWARPRYDAIVSALRDNAAPAVFSEAVVQSPYAESHYGVGAAGAGQWTQPNRGLGYLGTLPVPPTVTATSAQGMNTSGVTAGGPPAGPGVVWVSPQVCPSGEPSVPGEPNMSPVPPNLVSIDPSNQNTWNGSTGFGQKPSTGGGGTGGGAGGGSGSGSGSGSGGGSGTGGGGTTSPTEPTDPTDPTTGYSGGG